MECQAIDFGLFLIGLVLGFLVAWEMRGRHDRQP